MRNSQKITNAVFLPTPRKDLNNAGRRKLKPRKAALTESQI